MNGLNIEERPIWYECNKKSISRSHLGKTLALPSASTMDQSSIRNYFLPPVSAKDKTSFQTHIALHYYATGTSFQRVEDGHLARAIAMLRSDANLYLIGASLHLDCSISATTTPKAEWMLACSILSPALPLTDGRTKKRSCGKLYGDFVRFLILPRVCLHRATRTQCLMDCC
jgi:hypothetical protein